MLLKHLTYACRGRTLAWKAPFRQLSLQPLRKVIQVGTSAAPVRGYESQEPVKQLVVSLECPKELLSVHPKAFLA
jgi:hypothetical protein